MNKKIIAMLMSITLMLTSFTGAWASETEINAQWNKLTQSQQDQLSSIGLGKEMFKTLDSVSAIIDFSAMNPKAVAYEKEAFTVNPSAAKSLFSSFNRFTGNKTSPDEMVSVFTSVIADINQTASSADKDSFARFLGSYGLCEIGSLLPVFPEGEKALISEKEAKEQLDRLLLEAKKIDAAAPVAAGKQILAQLPQVAKYIKFAEPKAAAEFASLWIQTTQAHIEKLQKEESKEAKILQRAHQNMIEMLSSQIAGRTASFDKNDIRQAWAQSAAWIRQNQGQVQWQRKAIQTAVQKIGEKQELTLPEGLWQGIPDNAQLQLENRTASLAMDKNTYKDKAAQIAFSASEAKGYDAAIKLENTGRIKSPLKLVFFVDNLSKDYGIYKIEEEKGVPKETLLGGIPNIAKGGIEAPVSASGTYAIKELPGKSYSDLQNVPWAAMEIQSLGQRDYVRGKASNTFAPQDAITRAEFATLITRVLNLPEAAAQNPFKDIQKDAWYYKDLMSAVEAKLFSGKSAEQFDPKGKITRQEAAAVLSRILAQKGYSEPLAETQEKGIWAPGALALLKNQEITTGIPAFEDQVGQAASRAEIAYALYYLLQH